MAEESVRDLLDNVHALSEETKKMKGRMQAMGSMKGKPEEKVARTIGDPLTMHDLMELQSLERNRVTLKRLHEEVNALRKTLEDTTGVVPRCGQCGKDTHYVDMMRTVDGLLICHHCAYWD